MDMDPPAPPTDTLEADYIGCLSAVAKLPPFWRDPLRVDSLDGEPSLVAALSLRTTGRVIRGVGQVLPVLVFCHGMLPRRAISSSAEESHVGSERSFLHVLRRTVEKPEETSSNMMPETSPAVSSTKVYCRSLWAFLWECGCFRSGIAVRLCLWMLRRTPLSEGRECEGLVERVDRKKWDRVDRENDKAADRWDKVYSGDLVFFRIRYKRWENDPQFVELFVVVRKMSRYSLQVRNPTTERLPSSNWPTAGNKRDGLGAAFRRGGETAHPLRDLVRGGSVSLARAGAEWGQTSESREEMLLAQENKETL
ncbi:hypothetical protein AAG570_005998 [Ranatra chinensis]|uniref:Uncharacterized protein n=1 Tax=Ranatra chinensis TaxID=642074 RepID=A0ABD0YBT3_9HEMI